MRLLTLLLPPLSSSFLLFPSLSFSLLLSPPLSVFLLLQPLYTRIVQEARHAHGMRCLKIPNTKHFHDITVIEVRVNPLINHQNTASVLVLSSRYPFINSHDSPPSPPSSLSSSSLILSPYSLPSSTLLYPSSTLFVKGRHRLIWTDQRTARRRQLGRIHRGGTYDIQLIILNGLLVLVGTHPQRIYTYYIVTTVFYVCAHTPLPFISAHTDHLTHSFFSSPPPSPAPPPRPLQEFEDSEGNILSKKTFEDLARQGLL